jgi:hypothetical protein
VKDAHAHRMEPVPGARPVMGGKCDKAECEFSCEARDIGLDSYVECLEERAHLCAFSVRYAHAYYCKNRARVYAAKQLAK